MPALFSADAFVQAPSPLTGNDRSRFTHILYLKLSTHPVLLDGGYLLEFFPIFNGLQNHSPFYKIQVYNGEKIA